VDQDFGVHKKVRNTTIVREVDHARQRDLVRTVAGGACVLVAVLFAAWQHLDSRQLRRQAADLSRERATLLEAQRHLKLEKVSLERPSRIEALATGQLKMKAATRETSAVIERVVATPPPASAVVAQR
jgi:cell division protein FtsL